MIGSAVSEPPPFSLESFAAYHASESWTWEHMALTRGRLVAGPHALREQVDAEIQRRRQGGF